VTKEKDGTLYLHVEDPKDSNRVSVWSIRPNHPSYDFLNEMAEISASGQQVSVEFEISDAEPLPPTEPESYIRCDSVVIGPIE